MADEEDYLLLLSLVVTLRRRKRRRRLQIGHNIKPKRFWVRDIFRNRKSILLLAICDAHYIFSFVNIWDYGSNNDSGVLENSVVGKAFAHDALCVPDPEPVEGCDIPLPYFIVGDDIFGLKTWLLRSFPGRSQLSEAQQIFNYRLSRARRVIENAFGILRARWRVFSRPIQASVETAEEITKAAVCLHNYLRQTNSASYCPSGFVDSEDGSGDVRPGEWRQIVRNDSRGALVNIAPQMGRRYSNSAIEVREALKKYFVSDFGSSLGNGIMLEVEAKLLVRCKNIQRLRILQLRRTIVRYML